MSFDLKKKIERKELGNKLLRVIKVNTVSTAAVPIDDRKPLPGYMHVRSQPVFIDVLCVWDGWGVSVCVCVCVCVCAVSYTHLRAHETG